MRLLVLLGLLGLFASSALSAAASSVGTGRAAPVAGRRVVATEYVAPLSGQIEVVRGFEPPPEPYAAGHRGVDLAVRSAQFVRAAGSGVVEFAGPVAGRGVVVLTHPDGVSTEYEPVEASVAAGDRVVAGQPIGRVRGSHDGCPPDACLHWGARRDGVYFDPLTLLQRLGPVRLLPWDRLG